MHLYRHFDCVLLARGLTNKKTPREGAGLQGLFSNGRTTAMSNRGRPTNVKSICSSAAAQ
jgi:hypothetical protein